MWQLGIALVLAIVCFFSGRHSWKISQYGEDRWAGVAAIFMCIFVLSFVLAATFLAWGLFSIFAS